MSNKGQFFKYKKMLNLLEDQCLKKKKNLRTLPVDHKCNSFILDTEQILKLHFTKTRSAQVGIFKLKKTNLNIASCFFNSGVTNQSGKCYFFCNRNFSGPYGRARQNTLAYAGVHDNLLIYEA